MSDTLNILEALRKEVAAAVERAERLPMDEQEALRPAIAMLFAAQGKIVRRITAHNNALVEVS